MANVIELGYMNPGRWQHIANTLNEFNLIPPDFSLEGFIYDRNPTPNLRWLYFSFFGTIVIAGLAFLLVWRFYKLNHLLKWEINERQKIINQLEDANSHIKTLRGILPICVYCKEIRDDKGYWNQLEQYLSEYSDVQFSHGVCEKCLNEHYPEETEENSG
jgi:hypothetical protein